MKHLLAPTVKTRRKRTSLLSVVALLISVVATVGAMPARAAGIEMTFLTPAYLAGTVKATERIVADWNKANPNATVKVVYGDPNNINDKLATSFAGGVAPDIFVHEAASLLAFSKQGYVAPITAEMRSVKSSIQPGLWRASSYRAQLYGLPLMTQSYTIFANVDMFKKAGIAIPTGAGSLTWDGFRALAKQLTSAGNYAVGWGLKSPAATFMIMGSNFNGTFFKSLTTSPYLTIGAAELEVPNRVHDMIYVDKTIDPASILISGGANTAPFLAGKYAMIVGGSYVASDLDAAAVAKGFNWTALPLLKGITSNQGANPQTISVSTQSKYKKQAAAFIRFLAQDKNLADLALGEALTPSTRGAVAAVLTEKKGSAGWTQIMNDSSSFVLSPFTLVPNYQKWKDTVAQPTWQQWVQGKITEAQMKDKLLTGWKNIR
ncbi:MAG: extracellular solute-binding protein [Actinobacteria bacterium]|nr:extracellular solute-binding protein [Actinomycetota bacterium]